MKLEGMTALVTGAARRIGAAFSRALAREGMSIVVHYRRSESEADALVREVQGMGVGGASLRADLDDPGQAEQLLARAEAELGPVSVLINNASTFVPGGLEDTDALWWQRDLTMHVTTPALLCRDLARRLPSGGSGRILNLLDWRATGVDPVHLAYTVSKSALEALTRNLAVELGPRITVNGVAPGAILPVEGRESAIPEERIVGLPIPRAGTVDEVVAAGLYLIRDADYTTGVTIPVDGGRHLGKR